MDTDITRWRNGIVIDVAQIYWMTLAIRHVHVNKLYFIIIHQYCRWFKIIK